MSNIENKESTDPLIAVGAANNRAWLEKMRRPNSEFHRKAICDLVDLLAKSPEVVVDTILKQQT